MVLQRKVNTCKTSTILDDLHTLMYYILFTLSLEGQGGKGVCTINGLENEVMLQPETC